MPQDEKTKKAFEMIEQGVKDVYTSDNFKKYLSCCSKFHSYSLNNTLLILAQNPNATHVAGYTAWQRNFHRHVDKGEKGMTILAPVTGKVKELKDKADEFGNPVLDEHGNPVQEERTVNQLRFKTTTVFDISQTSGEPLPSLVHNLTGSSEEILALTDAVKDLCTIPIDYHTPEKDHILAQGAKGYYSPSEDKIVLNAELSDLQIAKTLVHEHSHSVLHKSTDKDSNQREIEAESLAFVMCDHFGIDTSDYSFGYIAGYADMDQPKLKSILASIQKTAHEMIDKLEPLFDLHLSKRRMAHEYITPVEMDRLANEIVITVVDQLKKHDEVDLDDSYVYRDIESGICHYLDENRTAMKVQDYLYSNHADFRKTLNHAIADAFRNPDYNPEHDHPLITNSIEHDNYMQFEKMASPLLSGDACYMKYSAPAFMDLHVEIIDDDRYSMSHNYSLNGDLMADPDVEFTVDPVNQLLYPQSYQQDDLQYYKNVDKDPGRAKELNGFMQKWMDNIEATGYHIETICTEEERIEDPSEIRHFCKEHNLTHLAPKQKEKER